MTKTAPFDEQVNDYDAWFEKHPDLYLAVRNVIFSYRQALLPGEITGLGVIEGHGSGGFVVIQAHKTEGGRHT